MAGLAAAAAASPSPSSASPWQAGRTDAATAARRPEESAVSHGRDTPPELETLRAFEAGGGSPPGGDTTPAVGRRGEPGHWRRAAEGATVALARKAWGDARWSYLYKRDTRYARRPSEDGRVPEAACRMRAGRISRRASTDPSSTRPCGRRRSRSTSGSAGSQRARRSSRSPLSSPAIARRRGSRAG